MILRDKEGRSPRGRSRYSECYNHSTPAAKFSKKERKKRERKRASEIYEGRSISLLGMKLDQHSLLEGTKLVVLISYLPPTLVNRLRLLEGETIKFCAG